MTETVLSPRLLNRTLLARQGLLGREATPVGTMLERLVGLQAQEPRDPYLALWSRLTDFDPEALSSLIERREAVRISLLRGTIHLVSAADCVALRAVTQDVQERTVQSQFRRGLEGLDLAELLAAGRALLHERPWGGAELGRELAPRWPDHDPFILQVANRYHHALVQVPPRGLWDRSGRALHVLAEDWLGRPLATDPAPDAAILRYLAVFGPASVADIRTWSGLAGLREAVERLRPRLQTYRDERGRELFDVPGGVLADPALPAPVRLLPTYDNVLLSHDDRTRIVPPGMPWERRVGDASFLVDGHVRGTWKLRRERGVATLHLRAFTPLGAGERDAVAGEAGRALEFLAAGDRSRELVLDG